MASEARLNVVIGAKISGIEKQLKKLEKQLNGFANTNKRAAKKSSYAWKQFRTQVAGLLSAGAISMAMRGFINNTKELIAQLDKLAKTADGLGMTIDEFTALSGVAVEAGAAQDKFAKGLAKLNKVIIDADAGLTTYTRAFDRLGISIHNADGSIKSSRDILFELKGAVDKYGASQEVIASLMDIFGARIGPSMVRVLKDMDDSMEGVVKRGRELGVVIDEGMVRKGEDAQNKLDLLTQRLRASGARAFQPAIGWVGTLADAFGDLAIAIADAAEAGRALEDMTIRGLKHELESLKGADQGSKTVVDGKSISVEQRIKDLERMIFFKTAASNVNRTPTGQVAGTARREDESKEGEKERKIRIKKEVSDFTKMQLEGLELANKMYWDKQLEYFEMEEEERQKQLQKRIEEVKAFDSALKEEEEAVESFAQTLDSNLSNTFQNIIDGTMSVEDAFKSMLANIITQIIQQQVTGPAAKGIGGMLGNLFGGGGGGGGGLFGNLFGGGRVGPAPGTVISTFPMASGGMARRGRPYTVGESGRELFIPGSDGRIMSHMDTKKAGTGGGSVVINQTNNFASGLTKQEVGPLLERNKRETLAAVVDGRRRGGSIRAAFGNG